MADRTPYTLRLSFSLVDEGFHFERHVARTLGLSARRAREVWPLFAMREPEKPSRICREYTVLPLQTTTSVTF